MQYWTGNTTGKLRYRNEYRIPTTPPAPFRDERSRDEHYDRPALEPGIHFHVPTPSICR